MTWQPIDTAPKDGSMIWLTVFDGKCIGRWHKGQWRTANIILFPKQWSPLG